MDIPQFIHFPTEEYLVCFNQLSLFFISLNSVFYSNYLIHKNMQASPIQRNAERISLNFTLFIFFLFQIFYNEHILFNQKRFYFLTNSTNQGFPGGTVVKNLPSNEGDTGSSPGPGRSHMPRSN